MSSMSPFSTPSLNPTLEFSSVPSISPSLVHTGVPTSEYEINFTITNFASERILFAKTNGDGKDGVGASRGNIYRQDRVWELRRFDCPLSLIPTQPCFLIVNTASKRRLYATSNRNKAGGVGASDKPVIWRDESWHLGDGFGCGAESCVQISNAYNGRVLYARGNGNANGEDGFGADLFDDDLTSQDHHLWIIKEFGMPSTMPSTNILPTLIPSNSIYTTPSVFPSTRPSSSPASTLKQKWPTSTPTILNNPSLNPTLSIKPSSSCRNMTLEINTDDYGSETSWTVYSKFGGPEVGSGAGYDNLSNYVETVCLPHSDCFVFTIQDSYGDGICCGTDDYGSETSWTVYSKFGGPEVGSGAGYDSFSNYVETICLPSSDCFVFNIQDSFGDGICCGNGNGSYDLWLDGELIHSGGDFDMYDEVEFGKDICVLPTCDGDNKTMVLELTTDAYSSETTWTLGGLDGNVIFSGGGGNEAVPRYAQNSTNIEVGCLPPNQCYKFTIFDDYGDGICCLEGIGSYEISWDGELIHSGGLFYHDESTYFGYACPSLIPTLSPTLSPPSSNVCVDLDIPGNWGTVDIYTCDTFENHGGTEYCANSVINDACCFCGGGISAQGVCYFDCEYLTLDHDGTQLGQVGNCGYNCTSGIAADINGVVHPELFLWKQGYWENGKWYNYGAGPLNVHDSDNNMFYRCYNECFVAVDDYIGNDDYIKKDQTSKNFGIMELTR
eukprot:CAMPEP_0194394622 /NCGR_PEP_ID=MMETSP0174-20130528/123955_1 /TAXON_ID=216777 /ORGANISM="Proboscia alata, Strain PI-D3" /LENGTH=723 /DNA_ID=CAMNT_0039190437 /DNA_START=588 /DNA_END=2759 /DNA_ORIENTATION=-